MKKVRITKLSAAENAEYQPPKYEEYAFGLYKKYTTTPLDYWCEGVLALEPTVGGKILLNRTARCGKDGERVTIGGFFQSSKLTKINKKNSLYYTLNSVYKIDEI